MSRSTLKAIGLEVLDLVSEEARQSPRLRKNLNLHSCEESACHRLFNGAEPGTYIRPHRHLDPEKDETLLAVRGELGVVSFDPAGEVTGTFTLTPGGTVAVDIPHGAYHTALSLKSGTVFFETKAGPYLPLSAEETAPFAPEEGSPEAAAYLERLSRLFR